MTTKFHLWRIMLSFYVVQFVLSASSMLATPILVPYIKSLGALLGFASLVATSSSIAMVATQILFGMYSDRIGRDRLLYASPVFAIVGPLGCYLAPDLYSFFAARMFSGFAMAIFLPVSWALAMDLAPKGSSGRALGNIGAFLMLGCTIGPVIGGSVATVYGARSVFLVAVIGGFLDLLLTHLAIRNLKKIDYKSRVRSQATETRPTMMRNFLAGIAAGFFGMMALGMLLTLFPAYAEEQLDVSIFAVSLILSVSAAAQVLTRLTAASISDKYGRQIVILAGLTLAALGIYGLQLMKDVYLLGAMGIVTGVGISLLTPAGAALVSDSIVSNRQGLAMGIYQTLQQVGTFSVIGWGYIAQGIGFRPMYSLVAVAEFAAGAGLYGLCKSPSPSSDHACKDSKSTATTKNL